MVENLVIGVRRDNTTQHNTTQHNTTQHNTTQHNTTQHNTTQHTPLGTKLRHTSTKRGFTLIELIFTIVIIGVLATVAIPKYKDLKENAEINSISKTISDIKSSVPSAFYNAVDLNGEDVSTLKFNELIDIKSKGWSFVDNTNKYRYGAIVHIVFSPSAKNLRIYTCCSTYSTDTMKEKCKAIFTPPASDTCGLLTETIEF